MPSPITTILLRRREAVAGKQSSDLLGALVAYLRDDAAITGAFGWGFGEGGFGQAGFAELKLFEGQADADARLPYLLIEDYDEVLPGETLEDSTVTLTLSILSASLDQARDFGALLKAAVDSVAINPASTRTERLTWVGGQESGVMRNPSRPYRVKGVAKAAQGYLYREDVEYEFWIQPTSA